MIVGKQTASITYGGDGYWGKFLSWSAPANASSVNYLSLQLSYAVNDSNPTYSGGGVIYLNVRGSAHSPLVLLYDFNYGGLTNTLFRVTYDNTKNAGYIWAKCPDQYSGIFVTAIADGTKTYSNVVLYDILCTDPNPTGSPSINGSLNHIDSIISPAGGGGGGSIPSPHETTHLPDGTDPLPWISVHGYGLFTDRPVSSPSNNGFIYYATDSSSLYRSNGSSWDFLSLSDPSKVLSNTAISPGTYTKITYDAKGLVTGGSNLLASDIPTLTSSKISDFVTAVDNSSVGTVTPVNSVVSSGDTLNVAINKLQGQTNAIDIALATVSRSYTHSQGVVATTWNVVHNLGYKPSVSVTTSTGDEVGAQIHHIDINTLSVILGIASSGYAYCS